MITIIGRNLEIPAGLTIKKAEHNELVDDDFHGQEDL